MREELTQLICQLGRQRLIRRHHQGWALLFFNEPRGSSGLTGTRGTHEDDVALAAAQPLIQFRDGGGLVACGLVL